MILVLLRDARTIRRALLTILAAGSTLTAACSGGMHVSPAGRPTPASSSSPSPGASASPGSSASPRSSASPGSSASPSPASSSSAHPGSSASPSAAPTVSPTPIDSDHVAFVVQIAPGAMSAAPRVTPSAVNIYVTGQQTTTGAGATCTASSPWLEVTDAQGDTAPFPAASATVAPISFYGNGTTSGTTSQVIQLPALCGGRIYISVNGPLAITSTSGPAPWAYVGSSGFPAEYDMVEYTMPANGLAAPSTDIDTSQENMIGLDLTLNMDGTQSGSQTTGVKGGFMTQVSQAATALSSTWGTVINAQWPTRLLSPLSVQYVIGSAPHTSGNSALPGFNPGTFLDTAIETAWNDYESPNCMSVTVSTATGDALAGQTVTGQVDSSGNFDFYGPGVACAANLSSTQSGSLVAQIPSPFNQNFWINYVASGWSSATGSELMENGPYLLPTSAVSSGGTMSFTNPYAVSSADIGNTIATALNRGVFNPAVNPAYATQPYCPALSSLYPATSPAATQNLWATAVWQVAKNSTYGYGKAYAIPYDDKCGNSTDIQDSGARVITVTVNAN